MPRIVPPGIYGAPFPVIKDAARQAALNPRVVNINIDCGIDLLFFSSYWRAFMSRVKALDFLFSTVTLFKLVVVGEMSADKKQKLRRIQEEYNGDFHNFLAGHRNVADHMPQQVSGSDLDEVHDEQDEVSAVNHISKENVKKRISMEMSESDTFHLKPTGKEEFGRVTRELLYWQMQELDVVQSKITYIDSPDGKEAGFAKPQKFISEVPAIIPQECSSKEKVDHFFMGLLIRLNRTDEDVIEAIKNLPEDHIPQDEFEKFSDLLAFRLCQLSHHKEAIYEIAKQKHKVCLHQAMISRISNFNPLIALTDDCKMSEAYDLLQEKEEFISQNDLDFAHYWAYVNCRLEDVRFLDSIGAKRTFFNASRSNSPNFFPQSIPMQVHRLETPSFKHKGRKGAVLPKSASLSDFRPISMRLGN